MHHQSSGKRPSFLEDKASYSMHPQFGFVHVPDTVLVFMERPREAMKLAYAKFETAISFLSGRVWRWINLSNHQKPHVKEVVRNLGCERDFQGIEIMETNGIHWIHRRWKNSIRDTISWSRMDESFLNNTWWWSWRRLSFRPAFSRCGSIRTKERVVLFSKLIVRIVHEQSERRANVFLRIHALFFLGRMSPSRFFSTKFDPISSSWTWLRFPTHARKNETGFRTKKESFIWCRCGSVWRNLDVMERTQ